MTLQQIRKSVLALPRRSRQKLIDELQSSLEKNACPPGAMSEDGPNFMKIRLRGQAGRNRYCGHYAYQPAARLLAPSRHKKVTLA